jgi:hypothetical protein
VLYQTITASISISSVKIKTKLKIKINLDLLVADVLRLDRTGRKNILDGLVCASEIFLDRNGVLDFEEDDRDGDEDRAAQQTEVGGIFVHEGELVVIQTPHDGRTG